LGRNNIRAQKEVASSFSGSSFVVIYRSIGSTTEVSSNELANGKQYEILKRIKVEGGETLSDFFTRSKLDGRRRLLLDRIRDGIVEKEGIDC
jgi:hypothetical protein